MFEMDKLTQIICSKIPLGLSFQPSDTSLIEFCPKIDDADEEETTFVDPIDLTSQQVMTISPRFPVDNQVIAVDSTNFTLGQITDGLVGAIRVSIITKPAGKTSHCLDKYGPYLVPVTNQNKDIIHKETFKLVHGTETKSNTPDCYNTFCRVRSWLERYIQTQVAETQKDSIIFLDGSLIGGTIGDPAYVLKKILTLASSNNNSIVSISKNTGLMLKHTQKSILSLLDGIPGPCYIGDIKKNITQDPSRYLGEIYVAKLTPLGEPFRIDIPKDTPIPHNEILSRVAGLAGDYGYPEELKLAHMTCVLSAIEILELQSAAIAMHGLTMKDELRPKIFPL